MRNVLDVLGLGGCGCGLSCGVLAADFLGSYWGGVTQTGAVPVTYLTRLPSIVTSGQWLDNDGRLQVYHQDKHIKLDPLVDGGTTYHCIGVAASQFVDGTTWITPEPSFVWFQLNYARDGDVDTTSPVAGFALVEVVDTTETGLANIPPGGYPPRLVGQWLARDANGDLMAWDSADKLCGYNRNGGPSRYTAVGTEHFALCVQRDGLAYDINRVTEWKVPAGNATSITATSRQWNNPETSLATLDSWEVIRYDRHAYPHALFGKVTTQGNADGLTQVDRETRYGIADDNGDPITSKEQWDLRTGALQYLPRQTVNASPPESQTSRTRDSLWVIDFAMKAVAGTTDEIPSLDPRGYGFQPVGGDPVFSRYAWHAGYVVAFANDISSWDVVGGNRIQNVLTVEPDPTDQQFTTNVVAGSDNTATQPTQYLYEDRRDGVVNPPFDVSSVAGATRKVFTHFGQFRFTQDQFIGQTLGSGSDPYTEGSNHAFKFFDTDAVDADDIHPTRLDGEDTDHFPSAAGAQEVLPANQAAIGASDVRIQGAGTGPGVAQAVAIAIENYPLSLAASGEPDSVDVGQGNDVADRSLGVAEWVAEAGYGGATRFWSDWLVYATLPETGVPNAAITPTINASGAVWVPFRAPRGRWYANGVAQDSGPLAWHGHVDDVTPTA